MKTAVTEPPLRVAWHQALAGIRVRLGRQLVTLAGIGLGIAFFSSVQTLRILSISQDRADLQRLHWLAITSLLMCLVGVTNSMLMSVTERYREIGTIKCLGASDQFVVRVFLLESLLLGTVGSGVGALSGGLLAALIESQMDGRVWMMVGETCLLGMAITSLAAIIPAIQAAKMPAAAALRMEG